MKKILLLAAGNISLFLGVAGIFLPVLPTTPFLLLSAACYLKGSERIYNWLTSHRIFGHYIKSYLKYRAVSRRAKIFSISFLWGVMSVTIIFFIDVLWLRILLAAIAVGVTLHLLLMKTLTPEMFEDVKLLNR